MTSAPSSRLADLAWWPAGLGGLLLLVLSASAPPLQTVADRPWPLWQGGPALPAAAVMLAAPAFLSAAALLAGCSRRCRSSRWRGPALALLLAALAALWLACLVRHDRGLTALHLACIALTLASIPARARSRLAVAAVPTPLLVLVSYGAIWGEARCDEPHSTGCLVASGPRLWVPAALERADVPVFVDLRDADLRGVDWRGRDLRLADLRGARLDGALLAGSNLRRARLDGVHAPDSNWRQVFMNGASMSMANLTGADMQGVQAYRVDLRGTNLDGADLRGASLSHAFLDDAVLGTAQLQGAYLRFGTGLRPEQVSRVGHDSGTRWPDELAVPKP